jgi:very-short-patch-repair endonuclease
MPEHLGTRWCTELFTHRSRVRRSVCGRWCGNSHDFHWPELGLVVETDGLRYHRTPAQQARDRLRDQAHVEAGLTCLRFTHAQMAFEPGTVRTTLSRVARRLSEHSSLDRK